MIELKHITKTFNGKKALSDISFSVSEGEIFGFLGPSGAGKTTTINILTGQLVQDSGQAFILGKDAKDISADDLLNIGFMSDTVGFYEKMSLYKNLEFFAKFHHVSTEVLDDLLRTLDLFQDKDKKAENLSTGMKQRLFLIRAILHTPKILFLDEPTTGLDPNQLIEIRQLISEVGKEKTVLFSTHIMQEVQALCQRVVVINKGNIVADEAESVMTQGSQMSRFEVEFSMPMHHDLAQISSDILKVDALSDKLYQISARSDVRELLFSFATEKKITILTMRQLEESMEEIFRALTK